MLFGRNKSCCDVKSDSVKEIKETGIYVLGSGCKKCNELEVNIRYSLKKLGIDEEVFHITDFALIAAMGVMSTPALVIDKKLISYGKVLSKEECENILVKERL